MIPIQASAGARWDHRAGPGAYRAAFVDPNGGRTREYHPDSPDYAGATPFNLTAGTTTTIDAALHHP